MTILVALFLLNGCLVTEKKFSAIPPGQWRGMLYLGSNPNPNAISMGVTDADNKLLFNFEVQYVNSDSFVVYIINGEERILINDLSFGHNRATGRDSLVLRFPEFGSYIHAYYEEDILEGRWHDPSRGNYSIPFLARQGLGDRFPHEELDVVHDVSGKWAVQFGIDTEDPWDAIGEFKQEGREVQGTFLTETGDYRFLEGIVDGHDLWLSAFDGAHAFLFKAKIEEDKMTGFFKSGNHYETLWEAKKDSSAQLSDAMKLTQMESEDPLDFQYYNQNGEQLSFSETYPPNGRPKLIQVMGTWCPNCKDETRFLQSYLKDQNPELDVISIAFERGDGYEDGYQTIDRYVKAMNLNYPIFYGGPASKKSAHEVFGQLNHIISYPTLIMLDHEHRVHAIHTGFSGPATSSYDAFKEKFYRTTEELILKSSQ